MARINVILPAMGEGVIEATINKWLVQEGTAIKEDQSIVEVATDKVDSEIPSPSDGVLVSIIAKAGTVAKVGDVIAIIENGKDTIQEAAPVVISETENKKKTEDKNIAESNEGGSASTQLRSRTPSGRFLSPLVRNIAEREKISNEELDRIKGTGNNGRITRDDINRMLDERQNTGAPVTADESPQTGTGQEHTDRQQGDEIIPMDRVRKLIADHMVMSKRVSPHVTSFIDADVTRLMNWRNSVKDKFLATEGQKLTLTPIFIDAAARALHDFPMINISVEGTNIIRRKIINIGMATALPDGNLIVPVIRNADEKSLTGLARSVNDLAERARKNKLKPDEITGGTFTITNFGSYDNLAGTPIINQPQAAILGTGAVRKTPAVIETPDGDMIAVRQIMILSLSYDHRVIDGALAGRFLQRVREILENYTEKAPF